MLPPPPTKDPKFDPNIRYEHYCNYHGQRGHLTKYYLILKNKIQDLLNIRKIIFPPPKEFKAKIDGPQHEKNKN